MLENYTWPVAFTAVSTLITIVVAAYKAYTRKPSDLESKLQTDVADLDRRLTKFEGTLTAITHAQEELKESIKNQANISKEAFQTTDKKLEKISDLIIELIRN